MLYVYVVLGNLSYTWKKTTSSLVFVDFLDFLDAGSTSHEPLFVI